MKVPAPLSRLIENFEKLPGVGPKSAQRLSYYLLHVPQSYLDEFSESLARLKKDTVLCSICKNISESDPCGVCQDESRDKGVIMVVEQPLDILAFEKTRKFNGLYHVLHGSINPLENIGPEELFIESLISRIERNQGLISEIIVATNPTMEGEATSMYITRKIKEKFPPNGHTISVTRLGVGVPIGSALEFADETTLTQAMEGRRSL